MSHPYSQLMLNCFSHVQVAVLLQDTKQALAQKPLSTAQTPMKPTMSDKSRCVAEHAGKKESASEGYRETRKLRTQTLKRLLESYETSACGTVARVGSQSLSIKDALQLQHKQTDSKLGGTSGDFRMVSTANRFEHHVSHTTAGGKALPESNFRIQANRLNVLEVTALLLSNVFISSLTSCPEPTIGGNLIAMSSIL